MYKTGEYEIRGLDGSEMVITVYEAKRGNPLNDEVGGEEVGEESD